MHRMQTPGTLDRHASGFVLAGGRSRRMGTDKALLPWRDTTLLGHMQRRLRHVVESVHVVGRKDLPDRRGGCGPVDGIATALASSTTEDNLVVALDLPFLQETFLRYLLQKLRTSRTGLIVTEVEGRVPLCIGIQTRLWKPCDDYIGSGGRSLVGLCEVLPHEVVTERALDEAGFEKSQFSNINTPEDYRQWRNSYRHPSPS